MDKKNLISELQKNYKQYWEVELFREQGWIRKTCKCGKAFWTLDPDRQTCGDVPCVDYGFIQNPPTKKKLDYLETWREIERFFVKNGHKSIPSYPVVCRWFPGLYFTIASIVAFQRAGNGVTFEFPANPLIIPQACLRFNDIPNVGRTGKHFTNFVMIGQHSQPPEGYWKDECIRLDYELLTRVFGIKPEEITWIEDAWVGPAAFGYSLEYMVRGLELGNAVFTEFLGTPASWKRMERPVIDMGAGLERFCWISQGTPTAYEAVFGPVIQRLKKQVEYDEDVFRQYARFAGGLNLDEVKDLEKAKAEIAKKLGLTYRELDQKIGPIEAIFAIADHIKSLLFASKDGSLPSNVGGGYNLRLVLRRAIDLRERYGLDIDFIRVAEEHAKWLKPLFPDLSEGLEGFQEVLEVETERYRQTKARGKALLERVLKKEKPDLELLIKLYESHGIPPELVKSQAEKQGIRVEIPDDFYAKVSERHMQERAEEEEPLEIPDLPATGLLYYQDEWMGRFKARVLKVLQDKIVILDRTAFYPEGGGQEADHGWILVNGRKYRVYDVKKVKGIVLHFVENPDFEPGEVEGEIDLERRERLRKHHTAIHLINWAAREVLGRHVWQAGSAKSPEKAHLDITHFKPITQEELKRISELSNQAVQRGHEVKRLILPRLEAEKRFGMRIYQGGAVPAKELRLIGIDDLDWEACGGLHCRNTSEIGRIIVISTERIQDGISRITIKAGPAAEEYLKELENLAERIREILPEKVKLEIEGPESLLQASRFFSVQPENLPETLKKFLKGVKGSFSGNLHDFCEWVFREWKRSRKEAEKDREALAEKFAGEIPAGEWVKRQVDADRKTLILTAARWLEKNPRSTILLWNPDGDVVCMSGREDARQVLEKLGIRGGGRKELAQGKAEPEKLKGL